MFSFPPLSCKDVDGFAEALQGELGEQGASVAMGQAGGEPSEQTDEGVKSEGTEDTEKDTTKDEPAEEPADEQL